MIFFPSMSARRGMRTDAKTRELYMQKHFGHTACVAEVNRTPRWFQEGGSVASLERHPSGGGRTVSWMTHVGCLEIHGNLGLATASEHLESTPSSVTTFFLDFELGSNMKRHHFRALPRELLANAIANPASRRVCGTMRELASPNPFHSATTATRRRRHRHSWLRPVGSASSCYHDPATLERASNFSVRLPMLRSRVGNKQHVNRRRPG